MNCYYKRHLGECEINDVFGALSDGLHPFVLCVHGDMTISICFFLSLSLRAPKVGMMTVFFNVIRTEKLLGLWKGVSPVSYIYITNLH